MATKTANELIIGSISNIDLDPIFSNNLRKQVEQVSKAATKIPVILSNASEVLTAEDVIKAGKKLAKEFEEIRKSFSGPLEEKKKQLIALERSVLEPSSKAVELLTRSVNTYHSEQARIAREAQDKLQADAAKKLARMSNVTNIAAVQQQTEEAVAAVAAPTTGTKKVKKFNVTDLKLVPREFLMIDEAKVKKAISSGVVNISGIDIYEEVTRSGR